jgi:hypothetical protein
MDLMKLVNKLMDVGFKLPEGLHHSKARGWFLSSLFEQDELVLTPQQSVALVGEAVLRFIQSKQPMLSTGTHGDWYARTGNITQKGIVASVHWDLSPMEAVLELAQKLLDKKVFA